MSTDLDLPLFTQSFLSSTPFFYFHHIIDAEDATLTAQVVGPNLCFTFHHSRAQSYGPSRVRSILEPKTVGFLSLVKGRHRHILAWAESGHGSGARGDVLDAPAGSPVLANALWTRRVLRVAGLLGIKMRSPFDLSGSRTSGMSEAARRRAWGLFLGGHVEVKLAVHAVYAMLREFGVTFDFDNVTRQHLEKLRRVAWVDGTRPSFEIYFSRKNCARCGRLIQAIEAVTGMRLSMCWKDRLVKKEYTKRVLLNHHIPQVVADVSEEDLREIIDIEDNPEEFLDDDDDGDVLLIDPFPIDLTDSGDESSSSIETIDLTAGSSSSPPESLQQPPTPAEAAVANDPADDYVNGLAYCVGQLDTSATPARTAIVDLAERMTLKKRREHDRDIDKPLPATPVMEFEEPLQPISGADVLIRRSTLFNTTTTTSFSETPKTPIKRDKLPARAIKKRKTTGRSAIRQESTRPSSLSRVRASLVETNNNTFAAPDSEPSSSSDESIPPKIFPLHTSPSPGPHGRQVASQVKHLDTTPTKPPKRRALSVKTSREDGLNVPFGPPLSRSFLEPPSPF